MFKILKRLKPFRIVCSFGTDKRTWTLSGARSWLPYCGNVAVIGQHGVVIEFRIQND